MRTSPTIVAVDAASKAAYKAGSSLSSILSSTELASIIAAQSKYVFAPWDWASDVIKFEPDKWQEQALRNLVKHRFLALTTGTGVGKTALLAVTILWFLATRPFPKIPCTAPSQRHLFDVLWPEVARWRRNSDLLTSLFKYTQTKVALIGHEEEWFAVARTSRIQPGQKSTEALQGYHSEHILIVVDEASGVADQVMSAVDGCITTPGAYALIAGNPNRRSGYFYRVTTDERLQVENGGTWKTQQVDARECKYADPIHERRAHEIYGPTSDYYRVKILGLPPLGDSTALITPEQVYAAHMRELPAEGLTTISCDPARYGDDFTVIMVRKGPVFLHREAVRSMDVVQVGELCLRFIDLYRADFFNVDVIGVGAGVADYVKRKMRDRMLMVRDGKESPDSHVKLQINEINVGSSAFSVKEFANLRAELFWNARKLIDTLSISFDDELLDEELSIIGYGWNRNDSRMIIDSKDQIRRILKPSRSPNDADAFVLNLYTELHTPTIVSMLYFQNLQEVGSLDIKPIETMKNTGAASLVPVSDNPYIFSTTRMGIGRSRLNTLFHRTY